MLKKWSQFVLPVLSPYWLEVGANGKSGCGLAKQREEGRCTGKPNLEILNLV